MLRVKLINRFLYIPVILRRLGPASPYVTVARQLYKIMKHRIESHRVEVPINFSFFRVINDRRLHFCWLLASSRRCIADEERDMEIVVLPDRIWNVQFVSIHIGDIPYPVRTYPFVIQLLYLSCRPEVLR